MQRETSPPKSGGKEERMEVDGKSDVALHRRALRVVISRDLRSKVICQAEGSRGLERVIKL